MPSRTYSRAQEYPSLPASEPRSRGMPKHSSVPVPPDRSPARWTVDSAGGMSISRLLMPIRRTYRSCSPGAKSMRVVSPSQTQWTHAFSASAGRPRLATCVIPGSGRDSSIPTERPPMLQPDIHARSRDRLGSPTHRSPMAKQLALGHRSQARQNSLRPSQRCLHCQQYQREPLQCGLRSAVCGPHATGEAEHNRSLQDGDRRPRESRPERRSLRASQPETQQAPHNPASSRCAIFSAPSNSSSNRSSGR